MSEPFTPDLRRFSPRGAKIVAVLATVIFAGLMVLLAFGVPSNTWIDQALFLLLGVLVGWLMFRLAGVFAAPSEEGLVVRNLFITTRLDWAEIVNVRFGDAWAQLDLSDGDTLAVMGIQRADGWFARNEAQRLANLVAYYGTALEH